MAVLVGCLLVVLWENETAVLSAVSLAVLTAVSLAVLMAAEKAVD